MNMKFLEYHFVNFCRNFPGIFMESDVRNKTNRVYLAVSLSSTSRTAREEAEVGLIPKYRITVEQIRKLAGSC